MVYHVNLQDFFGENSQPSLLLIYLVLCTMFVLAIDVQPYQYQSTMSHLTQLTLINDITLFMHAQLVSNFKGYRATKLCRPSACML